MSDEKQHWVYTDKGPELEKVQVSSRVKLNKWYFITPWILFFILLIALYSYGGAATGVAIFLTIFGPMLVLMINAYTFKLVVINPLKKQTDEQRARIQSKHQ